MDPLSALASSIAVAGLAQKVIKKTAQAFDHFRDAPVELNSLRRNVLLLQSLAKRIEARRTRLSLHDEVEQSLRDCLLEAEAAINDLLEESAKYVQPKNELCKRSRLKWAFVGSPAMEKFERRIKKTLDALNSIILTIILSPLQRALYLGMYDITRLLLSRQANGEHVSAWRGWSPLLYLLEGASRFEGTQPHGLLDFLDALNNDSIYVDTEAQAHTEQNALQLASAWYSGEVVQRLFNLGASMASFGRRPWRYPGNPIWNAIYKNNISAFQVLLEHYEDLNALDRRKFSMIGYTARNGHIEMTSLLLERGAEHIVPNYDPEVDGDIKIVGFPVPSSKDTALKDDHEQLGTYGHDNFEKESDDADFDLNDKEGIEPWTRKNYMKYLDALNRHGRVTIRANDNDEGGADDVFWDATSDPWEYFGT
ncbi:Fc.00g038710.m01.CDS01 [Cosmosporella sp. VM-42]